MPNQYVNKVVQSNGTTLIDISDTTAVASDVSEGKYFYLATGEKVEGTSSGGDSTIKRKTGSFTPTQNYDSNVTVKITDISDIGFTPTRFYFWVDKISDLSQTQYAITRTSYENLGSTPMHVRLTVRYTNATGSVGVSLNSSSWTTRTNGWLYANETSIYFRASSGYTLLENVKYNWIAED